MFLVGSENISISTRVMFQPFQVIQGHWFWHQAKACVDFLLVLTVSVVYFAPFRRYSSFCVHLASPLFHPNFGVFPLNQITHVGVSVSTCLKLFGREIIFEVFQPTCPQYLNVTDGRMGRRTDRGTDDMQSHYRALCSIVRW